MPEGILEQKKGGAKNVQMKRNRKRRTLSAVKKKRKTQRNIRLGFLILGIVLVVMLIIKINNPGFFSISIMRWIRKQWMHQSLILMWSF